MDEYKIEGKRIKTYINPDDIPFKDVFVTAFDPQVGIFLIGTVDSNDEYKQFNGSKFICFTITRNQKQYAEKLKWMLESIEKGVVDGKEFYKIFH